MIRINPRGVAAVLACALGTALVSPMAQADKHDSNTLHKLGKAIEYPIRKTSENASIAATGRSERSPSSTGAMETALTGRWSPRPGAFTASTGSDIAAGRQQTKTDEEWQAQRGKGEHKVRPYGCRM